MRAAILVVGLAGCWSAQPAWTTPPTAIEQAPLPECPIRLADTGHLFVWEADLGAFAPEGPGKRELAIYQTGSEALVALREPEEQPSRAGETLWKVSCDGRKLDTLTIAGADFGHAALHADRRRLFYSHGGVAVLDLVRRTHTQLTSPGVSKGCGALRDIVRAATRDHVEFVRSGPCGFEGAWDAKLMRRHIASGVEEKSTPITGVIENAGEIWLAAGDCGSAAIYRSTDWRSWKRLTVPNTQGPITLVAGEPHTIVMATGLCSGTGGGFPATITRDGGKTWTSISKDVVIEWVEGADVEHLRAGAANGRRMQWDIDQLAEGAGKWTTAPALPDTIPLDGRRVRATRFGLYDAATDERLFPR